MPQLSFCQCTDHQTVERYGICPKKSEQTRGVKSRLRAVSQNLRADVRPLRPSRFQLVTAAFSTQFNGLYKFSDASSQENYQSRYDLGDPTTPRFRWKLLAACGSDKYWRFWWHSPRLGLLLMFSISHASSDN